MKLIYKFCKFIESIIKKYERHKKVYQTLGVMLGILPPIFIIVEIIIK